MARSRSPKSRKGGGFDIADPNVQLAITSAAICAMAYFYDGDGTFDQNTLTEFFSGDHAIPYWPFGGFVLTMHCLNTCQNAGGGFWVNSFAHAFFVRLTQRRMQTPTDKQHISAREAHAHNSYTHARG